MRKQQCKPPGKSVIVKAACVVRDPLYYNTCGMFRNSSAIVPINLLAAEQAGPKIISFDGSVCLTR